MLAFASMVGGAPLCLCIILHGLLFLLFALFINQKRAGYISLLVCLIIGMAFILPLYGFKTLTVNPENIHAALGSERWQERIAALRYIDKDSITDDQIIESMQESLSSPHIAERYWYVRALGNSKNPAVLKILFTALDDPNTNVVSMAFFSLGRMKDKTPFGEILNRLERSDKWYEQRYGYRALRSLGWRQTK